MTVTERNPTEPRPAPEPTRDAEHEAPGGEASARRRCEERLEALERQFRQFKQDATRFILERTDPDVAEHLGRSGREFLLAMRAFIDKEIAHIDKNVARCREYHDEKSAGREDEKTGAASKT
ncbi:MAG: hypothetical protein Kow0059_14520 [Candidatus Sumerlaeia bacterium]